MKKKSKDITLDEIDIEIEKYNRKIKFWNVMLIITVIAAIVYTIVLINLYPSMPII